MDKIATFVLTLLVLPTSNSVVERVFSYMNAIKSKSRNKLQTEMLNALMRVRTEVYFKENRCCKVFSVTQNMLQKFNSDFKYKKTAHVDRDTVDIFDYITLTSKDICDECV